MRSRQNNHDDKVWFVKSSIARFFLEDDKGYWDENQQKHRYEPVKIFLLCISQEIHIFSLLFFRCVWPQHILDLISYNIKESSNYHAIEAAQLNNDPAFNLNEF